MKKAPENCLRNLLNLLRYFQKALIKPHQKHLKGDKFKDHVGKFSRLDETTSRRLHSTTRTIAQMSGLQDI